MKRGSIRHLAEYLVLMVILFTGLIFFFYFNGFPQRQFDVVIITSVIYGFWGILHHAIDSDLRLKIVVEYMLVSLLAIVIMKGILIR